LDNNPNKTDSGSSPGQKGTGANAQFAMAIELPIIFVAAVVIGGGLGYFIDHWLHTKFIFMFVFGGLGFFAGLREILRRLPG
jgi:F0F1-type ATP synthase assembly protein I